MYDHKIIQKTADYVKSKLEGESSGHDWYHTERVCRVAKFIGQKEKADLYVVELAALLHDIADFKLHGGDDSIGPKVAGDWLSEDNVEKKIITQVCSIIKDISFKGAKVKAAKLTLEGMVVQDADRLDALGAIGIARAFAFGGHAGRPIYDPNIKQKMHESFEQYKTERSHTINHFYEKLLLIKDLMNTETGKRIARKRTEFMEDYLKRFYAEWESRDIAHS